MWARTLLRSRAFQIIAGTTVIYWPTALLVPPIYLNAALVSVSTCLAATVVLLYSSLGWETVKRDTLKSHDRLILGIILSWLVRTIVGIVACMVLLRGSEFSFSLTPFYGYVMTILMLASILHITAPAVSVGEVKTRNWRAVVIALCIGSLITGVIIGIGFTVATGATAGG